MNFDLNLKNYKPEELEEIFDLNPHYNESELEKQEHQLRNCIQQNKDINIDLKQNIFNFIVNAKDTLRQKLNSSLVTTIQKTYGNVYNTDKNLAKSNTLSDGGTFIIQKPVTAYAQSKPSEFYQGTINPLDNRILRQSLSIDTRFRDNYYQSPSSNFTFELPLRITQVVSMQLTALELPSTFYSISSSLGNNYFAIVIGDVTQIIIIPDGNYTPNTLVDFLNIKMCTYTTNEDVLLQIFQYIYFAIDLCSETGTGKMNVGINNKYEGREPFVFSLVFNIDINGYEDKNNPLPLKFGWIAGFREKRYEGNTFYYSEGIVDMLGPKYLYLVVNDFHNNVNDGFYVAFNTSILNKSILARISLQGSVFNLLSQNNLSLITYARQYFGPIDIQKLQVQLLDEYGRIINLNNMDYSFCLTFQTVYDL